MNYVYPEPWCINSAVLLCNVHSSCNLHLRQSVKCGYNVCLHHPLSNTFISITSPWSFKFLLTCMPSWPEIPTPTSATWIILTSLAPSPRINEKNREKVRKRGKWVMNSISLCTMSACINANIASAAKCSAGKNKQHKLSTKEPRNKLRFLKWQCISRVTWLYINVTFYTSEKCLLQSQNDTGTQRGGSHAKFCIPFISSSLIL